MANLANLNHGRTRAKTKSQPKTNKVNSPPSSSPKHACQALQDLAEGKKLNVVLPLSCKSSSLKTLPISNDPIAHKNQPELSEQLSKLTLEDIYMSIFDAQEHTTNCIKEDHSAFMESQNMSSSKETNKHLSATKKRNLELNEFKGRITNTAMLFTTLGFAFLSLGAFISRSMETNVVPYVVTIDTHGVVRSEGTLDKNTDYMKKLPEQVISAQLCNFINDMRMVTSDKNMQKKALSHVFSCLKRDSKVFVQLQNAFEQDNPLNPQGKDQVQVEIANVIPLDKYTYQIDWVEKHSQDDDVITQIKKMRALISYEITSGYYQDPNLLMLNPLNIFIKELVVSPIIA